MKTYREIHSFVASWLTFGYREETHMLLVDKCIYPPKDINIYTLNDLNPPFGVKQIFSHCKRSIIERLIYWLQV